MQQIEVKKDVCIGCGACQAICPEVFEINDQGLAEVKEEAKDLNNLKEEVKDMAIDALENCPVQAIVANEQ